MQLYMIEGTPWLCDACRLVAENDLKAWMGYVSFKFTALPANRAEAFRGTGARCARCEKTED